VDKLFETFRAYANKYENRLRELYLRIESDGSGYICEESNNCGSKWETDNIIYFSNADEGIQRIKELQ
jgi:hypothetical protein